jgi:hypothetical protein
MGIERCYTSIAYPYKKFSRHFKNLFPDYELVDGLNPEQLTILKEMQQIASEHGIDLYTCCNDALLKIKGIRKGHCIDGRLLNKLVPQELVSRAKAPTRTDCGCTKSIDIGNYSEQPCAFGCIYCYANPVIKD